MKTLQELQQEVRVLEDDLRGLGTRLGQVAAGLDELRHAGDDSTGIDFDAVRFCAKQLDFTSHPLAERDPDTARLYLTVLLSLARFRKEIDVNLLIFAQWILQQTKLQDTLSSLLLAGYDLGTKQLRELREHLGVNWAPMLTLDLLVGAGLSGPPDEKALEYIGELALLFQLDEDVVENMAAAARCSLRQSLEDEKKKKLVDLPGYAKIYWTKDMRNAVFAKQAAKTTAQVAATTAAVTASVLKGFGKALRSSGRHIDMEEKMGHGKEIFWTVSQGAQVKMGDPIALIQQWNISDASYRTRKAIANYTGKLFQIKRDNIVYGVVSVNSNDSLDEVSHWLDLKKGGAE